MPGSGERCELTSLVVPTERRIGKSKRSQAPTPRKGNSGTPIRISIFFTAEGVFDERSRVLYNVVRINDPYALSDPEGTPLRMGTFVHAIIPGKRMSDLVVLPRSALHSGNQLWIVDEQSQLRRRQVAVLRTEGDEIFVSSGLDEGDLVVLTVLDNSFAGALVEIISTVDTPTGTGLLEGESLNSERVLSNDSRDGTEQATGTHAS